MFKAITSLLALRAYVRAMPTHVVQTCNGHTALCSRPYENVTFAAAHNAAFVGHGPASNQHLDTTALLDQGIRYFTTQTHERHHKIRQCHTNCHIPGADGGDLSRMVDSLKTWMDKNPRHVVTLLITNGDGMDIARFAEVFDEAGAGDMVYTPTDPTVKEGWPTLGEMIDSGKRLVVFMDYHADTTRVPYILPQYDYYVETPFSPTKENFLQCDVHRPHKDASPDNRMIFMNHNLNLDLVPNEMFPDWIIPGGPDIDFLIPNQEDVMETNFPWNIRGQANICGRNFGRYPNVVMLDFVEEGQVMEAEKQLNGLATLPW